LDETLWGKNTNRGKLSKKQKARHESKWTQGQLIKTQPWLPNSIKIGGVTPGVPLTGSAIGIDRGIKFQDTMQAPT